MELFFLVGLTGKAEWFEALGLGCFVGDDAEAKGLTFDIVKAAGAD